MHNSHFFRLKITDRDLQTTPWPVILENIVNVQESQQLCVVKDLSCHEVIMRIMRKENYLTGMLNKGLLAFPISSWIPGAGPAVKSGSDGRKNHLVLTKTFEWTLNWCILQCMFDRFELFKKIMFQVQRKNTTFLLHLNSNIQVDYMILKF